MVNNISVAVSGVAWRQWLLTSACVVVAVGAVVFFPWSERVPDYPERVTESGDIQTIPAEEATAAPDVESAGGLFGSWKNRPVEPDARYTFKDAPQISAVVEKPVRPKKSE